MSSSSPFVLRFNGVAGEQRPHSMKLSNASAVPAKTVAGVRHRRLRVGVVGIGRMGQQHALNVLLRVPRATLVCVCSKTKSDLEWAEKHLEPHGVSIFSTFEEMIESPGLEAVIIASPTDQHVGHTLTCLSKAIHVLCEKPIAQSVGEQLNRIVRFAEARPKTKVMVAFARRFDENHMDAKEKTTQGLIGKPTDFFSRGCEKFDSSHATRDYLQNSPGIFVDSAIHEIDLSLTYFGENVKPRTVSAFGQVVKHKELAKSGNAGDADCAHGLCQFWDDRIAYFYHNRISVHGYDNPTEVWGTDGKIGINLVPVRNRVQVSDATGVRSEVTPGWYERYEKAFITGIAAFVDAVLDGEEVPIPLRSSLTSLNIALALQKSMRTRENVHFDEEGNMLEQAITSK